MLGVLVRVVALPFRYLLQVIDWMGRVASLLLGFLLMVVGAALLAGPGPLMLIGVPLFVFGLFLTLRSLG